MWKHRGRLDGVMVSSASNKTDRVPTRDFWAYEILPLTLMMHSMKTNTADNSNTRGMLLLRGTKKQCLFLPGKCN